VERGLTTGDGLSGVGGLMLLVALFLPWSHQLPPSVLERFGGSSGLAGIPANPNAWQVYNTMQWVLVILAAVLITAWANAGWRPRLIRGGLVVVAGAFVLHALIVAPTDGLPLASGGTPAHYLASAAGSGAGERFALVGLLTALIGLALGPPPPREPHRTRPAAPRRRPAATAVNAGPRRPSAPPRRS
jgi:hypothetical protein